MTILAIDPGTTQSAFVILCPGNYQIVDCGILDHEAMRARLMVWRSQYPGPTELAVEMIASYGMAVGKTVFETCVWIGRYVELWGGTPVSAARPWSYVYRKDVKLHLCGSPRAKDANIRQAILDLYPPAGGGKVPQVGTSKEPGPLYGVSKDIWAALAVGITYLDSMKAEQTANV
jgi:hypothetical protein